MDLDQKKLKIAYHEIGHAVMALRYRQAIHKVSLKEISSSMGTDKYKAFMQLEKVDPQLKFTGEKAIQKIMISLGGYASEAIFYDGLISSIGGDDLTVAAKIAEDMLQVEEFKNWIANLPLPAPGPLDMIENQSIRAYIHLKIGECIEILSQVSPAIKLIADELYKKEELTGDEVLALFNSFMQSNH